MAALAVPDLSERERSELISDLDATIAPCADSPVPLSQCLAEKRACPACKTAGLMLGRMIHAGAPRTDRQAMYTARFDPKGVVKLEVGESPTKGPADAPVTIFEWADFECPHCALIAIVLELMQERFPGQIRVVYKFYALPSHTHALDAAFAARAAHKQDKFWEMNQIMFENQDKLEKKDLLVYAQKVGLDQEKFVADFDDKKTKEFVAADMKQGDDLGLDGTPMLFCNGRKMPLEKLQPLLPELEAWLKSEIEAAGKTPAQATARYAQMMAELAPPAPSSSASAGPSAPPPEAPPSAAPSTSAAPAAGSAAPKK
ncbi:MAG: thioredoxin domain-containing protein [Myxococcales bacterium]|nr:thioredoxin domain-containing protein [Myxococcales bacterium]